MNPVSIPSARVFNWGVSIHLGVWESNFMEHWTGSFNNVQIKKQTKKKPGFSPVGKGLLENALANDVDNCKQAKNLYPSE